MTPSRADGGAPLTLGVLHTRLFKSSTYIVASVWVRATPVEPPHTNSCVLLKSTPKWPARASGTEPVAGSADQLRAVALQTQSNQNIEGTGRKETVRERSIPGINIERPQVIQKLIGAEQKACRSAAKHDHPCAGVTHGLHHTHV